MSLSFDPGDDFPTIVDRVETVQLYRTFGGGIEAVDGALRRGHLAREYPNSGGHVVAAECRWHLPVSVLSDPPAIGDRIVDAAATAWIVVEVRYEGSGRWVCIGRDLALMHGLSERITIERATWTKDAAGAAIPTWHLWRAAVPARIQPIESHVSEAEGRVHVAATHRVLLVEPLPIDEDCRVVGPDGRIYRILMHHPAADLQSLDVLDVCDKAPLATWESP